MADIKSIDQNVSFKSLPTFRELSFNEVVNELKTINRLNKRTEGEKNSKRSHWKHTFHFSFDPLPGNKLIGKYEAQSFLRMTGDKIEWAGNDTIDAGFELAYRVRRSRESEYTCTWLNTQISEQLIRNTTEELERCSNQDLNEKKRDQYNLGEYSRGSPELIRNHDVIMMVEHINQSHFVLYWLSKDDSETLWYWDPMYTRLRGQRLASAQSFMKWIQLMCGNTDAIISIKSAKAK